MRKLNLLLLLLLLTSCTPQTTEKPVLTPIGSRTEPKIVVEVDVITEYENLEPPEPKLFGPRR